MSHFLSLSLSPRLLYLCTFHYSVASLRWQGCNNFGQMLVNTSDKWNSPCRGSAGRLPAQGEVTHPPTEERRSMSIPSTENASSIRKLYTPPQPGNKHQIVCRSFAFPHSLHIENTHTHYHEWGSSLSDALRIWFWINHHVGSQARWTSWIQPAV